MRTRNLFQQLHPKREDLPFWERINLVSSSRKNHPLSEGTKFILLLCMLVVFGVLKNISFSNNNRISKFFTEGFENLLLNFFSSSENLLLSIEQCTWLHMYFPFGKFHSDIHNKMADNNGPALPHETDFDISNGCFWLNWYIYQVIWKLSIAHHSIWITFIFLLPFAYVPTLLFWMGGSRFDRATPNLLFLP